MSPLRILNRSGNQPSHYPAVAVCDEVVVLLRTAGFRNMLLRGDTVYSQTEHLDRWDQDHIVIHFGYDAMLNLVKIAGNLGESQWERLQRPSKQAVKTKQRTRPHA